MILLINEYPIIDSVVCRKSFFSLLLSIRTRYSTTGGYKTKTEDRRPKNEDPFKIVLKSLLNGSNVIVDRSRNEKQQDLRLSTNLTWVFVLYITLPNVQNEDPLKIVLKSLQNGSNVIVDRSRNEKQQDLRLSTNLTWVFVLYITLPNVQNEDPFKIVLKSLQNGSNLIVDRSRNEKQQDLRLSTNLTRVFVLYITLPKYKTKTPSKSS